MTVPATHLVDVLLLLTKADHVLLALRECAGYAAIWTEGGGVTSTLP